MTSNLGIRSIGNRLRVSALAQRSLLRPYSRGGTVASRSLVTKGHLLQQQQQDHQRQQPRQRQFAIDNTPRYGIRNFHRSCTRLEDEEEKELSPKEKKKRLKAKAKAAAAEQQEDAAAEKDLQEKLAAKKAAAAAGEEPPTTAAEEEPAPAPKEETAPETENEAHTSAKETPSEKEKEASEETKSASPSSEPVEYSTPELTADAAKHKAGLDDPDLPYYQNPLHHNNPEMQKMFRQDFESEEAFEAAKVPLPPMDLGDGKVPAPEYIYAIADEIVHLTMLEMNELVNKMAEHYGFHEGILSPDDDGGVGDEDDDEDGGDEATPKEEAKTSFDIKLVEFDAKAKIKVIKEVRALAGLGLKEAKEMVEGAPKVIHKGVKKEEADEIKAKLEEIGATIEIV